MWVSGVCVWVCAGVWCGCGNYNYNYNIYIFIIIILIRFIIRFYVLNFLEATKILKCFNLNSKGIKISTFKDFSGYKNV